MEAPICRICKVFFGCKEGLCSKCFNEAKTPARVQVALSFPVVSKPVEEVKTVQTVQEVKPDRCFSCKKLLGPMSFKCKCSNYYCTRHRHPEEHSCGFDHKTEGIKKLAEDNPLVQAPKFNRL